MGSTSNSKRGGSSSRGSSRHGGARADDRPAMKIAYAITERNGKSFWNRIGVAFVNRDGSINVKLDAVPVSGELQIRDYEAKDDDDRGGRGRDSDDGDNDDKLPF